MIRTRRVYEPPSPEDGRRVLVDRLWPRGMTKARASIDAWAKDLAPSSELRKWFDHRPERFESFRLRFRQELARQGVALEAIALEASKGPVTLVFAARDPRYANARVVAELVEERLRTMGVRARTSGRSRASGPG